MAGFKLSVGERERIARAVEILGTKAKFATRLMEIGEQLDVRRPKTWDSAESVIGRFLTDGNAGLSGWMRDLALTTADDVIENADLGKALEQEKQRSEDYRESALKKEAIIRGLRKEIGDLNRQIVEDRTDQHIVTEVEQDALTLLRRIVMAENGDLDSWLLKASRLVLRADEIERS